MSDQPLRRFARVRRLARMRRLAPMLSVSLIIVFLTMLLGGASAAASPAPFPDPIVDPIGVPEPPAVPDIPTPDLTVASGAGQSGSGQSGSGQSGAGFDLPAFPGSSGSDNGQSATIGIEVPDVTGDSSNAVVIILLLSVLSIAPSLLILTTSFTRIVIVMSLTRNALGIPQLPPQQVIVGLSIFLSLFVMGPTLETMNEQALQPLMNGELSFTEAADAASDPIREFMLQSTREAELEMFLDVSDTPTPIVRDEVPLRALIPAFVLSELKSAFIMGFIIFVPFMVIDLVVSAVLTSLGMMMLPPTFVSLPLKLLLFILLDGWTLIVGTLLASYQ